MGFLLAVIHDVALDPILQRRADLRHAPADFPWHVLRLPPTASEGEPQWGSEVTASRSWRIRYDRTTDA